MSYLKEGVKAARATTRYKEHLIFDHRGKRRGCTVVENGDSLGVGGRGTCPAEENIGNVYCR